VPYAFTPMALEVSEGDCVHFQWTGSDANPVGNRGYGRNMTDRTNLVELEKMDANVPARHSYDEVTILSTAGCGAKLCARGSARAPQCV
jgi:plastocyanin